MALIALSTILSIILGSCLWLVLGSKFPLEDEDKWPIANNIAVYAVILLMPVYLTIFLSSDANQLDLSEVKDFLILWKAKLCIDMQRRWPTGPILEVGSYCGKSDLSGMACRSAGVSVYAVDHHRGSEEHQPGEYHDESLFDEQIGLMDSFREFRRTVRAADLENIVIPLVTSSEQASRHWGTPLHGVY